MVDFDDVCALVVLLMALHDIRGFVDLLYLNHSPDIMLGQNDIVICGVGDVFFSKCYLNVGLL